MPPWILPIPSQPFPRMEPLHFGKFLQGPADPSPWIDAGAPLAASAGAAGAGVGSALSSVVDRRGLTRKPRAAAGSTGTASCRACCLLLLLPEP